MIVKAVIDFRASKRLSGVLFPGLHHCKGSSGLGVHTAYNGLDVFLNIFWCCGARTTELK